MYFLPLELPPLPNGIDPKGGDSIYEEYTMSKIRPHTVVIPSKVEESLCYSSKEK